MIPVLKQEKQRCRVLAETCPMPHCTRCEAGFLPSSPGPRTLSFLCQAGADWPGHHATESFSLSMALSLELVENKFSDKGLRLKILKVREKERDLHILFMLVHQSAGTMCELVLCMCVHMCVEARGHLQESFLGYLLPFWSQGFSLAWNFTKPISLAGLGAQRSSSLCLPSTRITRACHNTLSLM